MIPARGPIRAAGAPHARRRGLAATAHRLAVDLTPQAVEQIAGRVAQLLRHDLSRTETNPAPAPGWMTAKELASHLKLNPAWVYEHAEELGVIRTGDGPKARMRFDLQTATQALQRHRRQTAPVGQAPKSRMPRRQPFGPGDAGAPLLEIRRREIRGVRSCFAPRRVRMGRV
jgi:hypothetical protein